MKSSPILARIVEGFEKLSVNSPSVSMLGSARTGSDHKHYRAAMRVLKPAVSITGAG